jgi:hypothetical protein
MVVANNTFLSMVTNAAHGLRIDVLGDAGFIGVIFINIFLFGVITFLCVNNKSGLTNADFVLAALGGTTSAALIQWLSRELLGYGSPYSLSKHTFALGSMFIVALVTVTLDMFFVLSKSQYTARNTTLSVSALAPALFMTLALFSIWWGRPSTNLRSVEMLDSDARQLAVGEIGKAVVDHTVAFHSQFSLGVNFAVAKGVLGLSGHNQIEQILVYLRKLEPEEQTAIYFLVSPDQMTKLHVDCGVLASLPLKISRLVHASCYDKLAEP